MGNSHYNKTPGQPQPDIVLSNLTSCEYPMANQVVEETSPDLPQLVNTPLEQCPWNNDPRNGYSVSQTHSTSDLAQITEQMIEQP